MPCPACCHAGDRPAASSRPPFSEVAWVTTGGKRFVVFYGVAIHPTRTRGVGWTTFTCPPASAIGRIGPAPAGGKRQQSTDSVEQVGAVSIHSHGAEKAPDSGVATRNLGRLSATGDSDFNVSHALFWTEIAKGLFQQKKNPGCVKTAKHCPPELHVVLSLRPGEVLAAREFSCRRPGFSPRTRPECWRYRGASPCKP